MATKYYPVSLADEKESYSPSDASSTTLLQDEQDLRVIDRRPKCILQSKWFFLAHVLFFTFSVAIFLRGITFSAPTTAKFVKEFSEYCECWATLTLLGLPRLIVCIAPAARVI